MQIVSAEEMAELVRKREELFTQQIDVQERIRKAAALGDLSENAEYHFAKEENRSIQRQLAELEAKNYGQNSAPGQAGAAAAARAPAAAAKPKAVAAQDNPWQAEAPASPPPAKPTGGSGGPVKAAPKRSMDNAY